jgi:hypothetical protein
MSKLYVNEVYAKGSSTKALEIDSSGRVLMPEKPAFFAYTATTHAFSSIINGVDVTQYMTSIDYNIGNYYSAANGFVAPVAGIYHFSCGFYYYSATDGELKVYKNNAVHQRLSNSKLGAARNPFAAQASFTMQLAVNDAVKLSFFSASNATMFNGNRNTFFSGFLVG